MTAERITDMVLGDSNRTPLGRYLRVEVWMRNDDEFESAQGGDLRRKGQPFTSVLRTKGKYFVHRVLVEVGHEIPQDVAVGGGDEASSLTDADLCQQISKTSRKDLPEREVCF